MANFAKAQLLKYGWTEGKGLGKNENGITEALKPKLKFNSEGVGYKPSEEVHWWQSAFNNAAKNVLITSENDEVSISVIDRNTTLRNLKAKQSRQEQYNNFRKLNVLQDEKLITLEKTNQEKEEEKESIKKIPILTDEELFKACGGRTLHKGARHGVGMNGKLERVANQEKKLMHLMNHLARKRAAKARLEMEEIFAKSGHKVDSNNANATLTTADVSSSKENGFIKSKATIKKEKKNIQHLTRLLTISCNINDNNSSSSSSHALKSEKSSCRKRKRSKDRRAKVDHGITNDNIFETITSGKVYDIPLPANSLLEKKNKKHKRHHKQNIVKESSSSGSYKESRCCDSKHNSSLKSKTKKSKHQEDSDINIKSPHGSAVKKLKYHNRKIIKLMERMSFDNSNDEHKKNEEDNSNANVTKSQHVFCNHEASRLNLRILKKKKHRLHKKNKEKLNLERRITSIQSQDKLSCIAENLMAINITEDVSAKLKRCKQGKEENKIEKTNDNEDRTCI